MIYVLLTPVRKVFFIVDNELYVENKRYALYGRH